MKKIFLLVMLLSCLTAQAQVPDPEVEIEAHIVDEAGQAVSNAVVTVGFAKLKTNNPFDGQDEILSKGVTGEKGNFIASNKTLGWCGIKVEREGYYVGRTKVDLKKHKDGRWIPWHQVVELKLRKKETPIPMYAKKLESFVIPVTDNPVGYDLMAGDWVSPHGRGVVSDIVLKVQREIRGKFDLSWQFAVRTPGVGNGLRAILHSEVTPESELRFPRTAPADGYVLNDIFSAFNRSAGSRWETNSTSATNFFFRVRTKYDEKSQLKSALYGKLLGPIRVNVQGVKTAKLYFTYYLNPTPLVRNMEFDPKRNLFKNLRFDEEVREP